jgi:hypothetical protein
MSILHPELSSAGPAVDAQWEIRQKGDANHPPLALLITPDSSNPDRNTSGLPALYHYLPQAPLLARDQENRPVFSLTLLLQRQPGPDDSSLEPLIERGVLAMTLTLNVSESVVQEMAESTHAEYQPLFPRQVVLSLASDVSTEQALAEQVDTSGSWMALSATLGRDETLGILSALQGGESRLRVNGLITYRTASDPNHKVVLSGQWEKIYEFLKGRFPDGTEFTIRELRAAFDEMIQSGLMATNYATNSSVHNSQLEDTSPLFKSFLRISTLILQRLTLDLTTEDPGNRYVLRGYAPSGELSISYTSAGNGYERFVEISGALQDVLKGAFDGLDLDAYIHLISPTSGGAFGPTPRRVTMPRTKAMPVSGPVGLAAFHDSVGSLSLALHPVSPISPTAQALLTSDAIQMIHTDQPSNRIWLLNDLRFGYAGIWFGNDQPAERNLPVVEDQSAPLWSDRLDGNRFWYAPTFEIVKPELNADPTTSPFLFSFTTSGHDLSGQAGLDGTVSFTLRMRSSTATQEALQSKGNPIASPVKLTRLSIALDLPFRDQNGTTRHQLFPTTTQSGEGDTIRATLRVVDNWVRLLYGALAVADFQADPAGVQISYTYEAYVPIESNKLEIVYGGKIATIPIIQKPEDLVIAGRKPYLNAQDGTFHLPNGVLQFSREMESTQRELAPASKGRKGKVKGIPRQEPDLREVSHISITESETGQPHGLRPIGQTTGEIPPIFHPVPIRPSLEIPPIAKPEKQYALQTLGSTIQTEILIPCEQFGVLYRQETEEGMQTIGCMDVLKLGQTDYKQYRLLTDPELRSPFYSIYRSLQMPERFLVLPTAYCITRFGPDEAEKAYRPASFLYSTIDSKNLANSRCVIGSTLQPDVPAYARRDLADKLRLLFHRSPSIEYITEIESQVQYEWSLPSTGLHPIQPQATKLWDSFQVSLSSDVDGVPQLQAMLATAAVSAHVAFTLPDGTILGTNLYLDLRQITGPWQGGPLEVSIKNGEVRLTNHIEYVVNVSDLRVYPPGQSMQTIQVDRSLAKTEVWAGSISPDITEVYPVYTLRSGAAASLQEIRSFIEDIHTNIIFLNQVNYANHNLKKLDITARIKDLPETYDVSIPEQLPASLDIILLLTSFLANPVLQFQVIKTDVSDQISRTPWLDWSLTTQGNIVSLTWALIENSQT